MSNFTKAALQDSPESGVSEIDIAYAYLSMSLMLDLSEVADG